jgi:hypothetical protein
MEIAFGAIVLAGGLFVGYRLWIAPRAAAGTEAAGVLVLVVLTLLGGLFGSPAWWFDHEGAFSWDLPPLASRMLAAAGFSFVAASLYALMRPSQPRLRLHLVLLSVYLAPLVLIILIAHLDRFEFSEPIVWSFFLIAGLMTAASLYFLARTPQVLQPEPADSRPGEGVRAWLLLIAAVMLLWGAALFVTDDGFSRLIWVWPGDLLSSRLIGVMLLAIGAGALFSRRSVAAASTMLATIATYGLLVAAANLWNLTLDAPVREAYVIAFAIIGLGSIAIIVRDLRETTEEQAAEASI